MDSAATVGRPSLMKPGMHSISREIHTTLVASSGNHDRMHRGSQGKGRREEGYKDWPMFLVIPSRYAPGNTVERTLVARVPDVFEPLFHGRGTHTDMEGSATTIAQRIARAPEPLPAHGFDVHPTDWSAKARRGVEDVGAQARQETGFIVVRLPCVPYGRVAIRASSASPPRGGAPRWGSDEEPCTGVLERPTPVC